MFVDVTALQRKIPCVVIKACEFQSRQTKKYTPHKLIILYMYACICWFFKTTTCCLRFLTRRSTYTFYINIYESDKLLKIAVNCSLCNTTWLLSKSDDTKYIIISPKNSSSHRTTYPPDNNNNNTLAYINFSCFAVDANYFLNTNIVSEANKPPRHSIKSVIFRI